MNTIRVALPGYNALTDTNPDHYALYADEDWVLIKEKTRGSVSVSGSGGTQTITHNLGYIPFFSVAVTTDTNYIETISGYNIYSLFNVYATTTTLVFKNNDSVSRTFNYYIFYDQQL